MSSRNDVSPRRLTLKKVLYHPLTLAALGLHIALILAPLNIGRLPLIAKVSISLAILLFVIVYLWRSGAIARPNTFKKVLYHPLTWAALGLHALLLTVPFSTEPSAVVEEEAIAEEAISVDLLNLSEIATSTPPPPQSEAALAPETALAPVTSSSVIPLPSASAPAPTAAPAAAASANQSSAANMPVQPAATPQPTQPTAPQPSEYDSTQDRGVFIQGLDSIGAMGLNDLSGQGLPLATDFVKGNATSFLGPTALATDFRNPVSVAAAGALPPGAASARRIDSQAKDVLKKIQAGYANTGITFNPASDYGGEPLYELKKPTGETFAFVSLVSFQGSSLMVLWTDNPNGASGG